MNQTTKKVISPDGDVNRKPISTAYKLNYNELKLMESARLNDYNLPIHHCAPTVIPDYCALYRERKDFNKTDAVAVAHFVYDREFDNPTGLYNAIYYNNRNRLKYYIDYYKDVKFIIAHDYSIFDDIDDRENAYRLKKIRTLMLWLVMNTNAVVVPNAVYVSLEKMPEYFSGLEESTIICFSTKSHVRYNQDRRRIKETVKFVVDHFGNLQTILVYSVCGKDEHSLALFKYAIEKGINVVILPNKQRAFNMKKLGVVA